MVDMYSVDKRGFKYDVVKLLAGIKAHPEIWDKTSDIYKDKFARKSAWDAICNTLEERYEQMSWEQKRATVEHVVRKWANIRDTFVRSLKTKMGKPKRRYLLYNQLEFLTKVIPENGTKENCFIAEEQSFTNQEPVGNQAEGTSSSFSSYSCTSTTKTKRADSNEDFASKRIKTERQSLGSSEDSDYEPSDDTGDLPIDFVEVESKVESNRKEMNEDESFFASLLPTVTKYNEDDRLEFRLQVLSLMKKIKENRKRLNNAED